MISAQCQKVACFGLECNQLQVHLAQQGLLEGNISWTAIWTAICGYQLDCNRIKDWRKMYAVNRGRNNKPTLQCATGYPPGQASVSAVATSCNAGGSRNKTVLSLEIQMQSSDDIHHEYSSVVNIKSHGLHRAQQRKCELEESVKVLECFVGRLTGNAIQH